MEDIIIENEEDGSGQDRIKILRDKLNQCIKEKEEYLTGWQRARADFVNARRDEENSRNEYVKFAKTDLIVDLLVIVDGLEMVLNNKNLETLDKNWYDGLKSIYSQFIEILKRHNVEVIESMDKQFNPEEHEAIGEILVSDKEQDNLVKEELRKGYRLFNKVIRPAQVRVGKFKEE